MSLPREAYQRAVQALHVAHSVVTCAHVRPDGDAIGATLGLTLALSEAGIDATPTLADEGPPPATYSFLPGIGMYRPVSELEPPDVFVSLDTPVPSRLGLAEPLMRSAKTVIVLDHHPDAIEFGSVHLLDSTAAATGQIAWRLLGHFGIRLTRDAAFDLYVALMTDTGRFSYDSASPEAFRDAAAMVEAGVDPAEAARLVYQERSAGALALEARAISRLTVTNGGHVAYAWIDGADFAETGALPEEAEQLPDAVRRIRGVQVAMLLSVRDGEVRGNLRSKTGFDVGAVARTLDGGGHRAAAGFTYAGDMRSLLDRVLPLLPGGASG
ncbi:MAG: recombinase RecJ [Coriobacteriaceae bacterium]|nr:recombinase RecJ [Coriobacteriaceae bacterium]